MDEGWIEEFVGPYTRVELTSDLQLAAFMAFEYVTCLCNLAYQSQKIWWSSLSTTVMSSLAVWSHLLMSVLARSWRWPMRTSPEHAR